ncbi:alpha/beta hydrolase-fold protein [Arcicella sp. LKC2W]|uniref:alpha/beta hydrolase n=1 Tax=Arcicella sp. LKC2W TaxID=2984198 RepID=UPI002B1F40EF|nr:alpha/beta hydrolase-fold protein [Arcicella sp. LKC2W]MEA5459672.1 alpha/beta hydrolase-fold protein [Arcicella sp. LKC2W]
MSKNILYFELTTPVEDERPVYISGNFNAWLPDKEELRLDKVEDGKYALKFPENIKLPETFEYKYTKGGWNQVELDEFGNPTGNRVAKNKTGVFHDFVPHWRLDGENLSENLMPEVRLISDEFEIPQLGKKRAVYILLPHNYEKSTKRYPVIYLQDAQNLFGNGSEFGNWGIDKQLAVLAAREHGDVIVVAIAHGGDERFEEYSPYSNPKLGKGQGRKYAQFLAKTLKPYIDKNYRTIPDRESTGIGGSSLGGLISIYAGLMFPEAFGRLMIFSPALWISPNIYFDAIDFLSHLPTRIYVYAGGQESAAMIPNVEKLKQTFERQGVKKTEINISLDPEGNHSEDQWGKEFPKAMEWLFF